MNRREIRESVIDSSRFPFWVPVITHYRREEGNPVDMERMRVHANQLRPYTRLWMVAGTTGDGWNLTRQQYEQVLEYALRVGQESYRPNLVIGALRPTTSQVIDLVNRIQQRLGIFDLDSFEKRLEVLKRFGVAGVTICAPVGDGLPQEQIYAHLSRVCRAANLPVILYQLPQVTRNLISAETVARLLEMYPQIIMFKDSGGGDEVARSGSVDPDLLLVRGAEGDFLPVLKQRGGWYDGWLLSTGNAFAPQLAAIAANLQAGKVDDAEEISRRLTQTVDQVFTLARGLPSGNTFSNSNRAVDHLLAFGKAWRSVTLPLLQDGSELPLGFLEQVQAVIEQTGMMPERGYMAGGR